MKDKNRLFYILLLVLALIVNFSGINVKFFTDDPGLYAAIAKNLIYKKDLLSLFSYNQDWLDKPHLPFWLVWCSFKLFGISVWAYRLPALMFFILNLVYTYLFSKKYYGIETAIIAVLIVMTSQSILMSNTDVRAEPYLMALVIGSIFHISQLEERFSCTHLLLAALLTACAIMTKGLFVIAAIYGGLAGQFIFKKKLKQLFSFKWLLLFLLTLVFILPEIYALYVQFDTHPEKVVFGRQHVSGIKWFLWDSQFGRFVNSGPITHKSGDVFFFVHTLLWAFAPWCLLFYYAVFKNIKQVFKKRQLAEYYVLSGGLLLLLLFSLSGFQLPFYTNTIFPLFAIITAPYCYKQLGRFGTKFRKIGLWLYIILLPLAIVLMNYFLQPPGEVFFIVDCLAMAILVCLIAFQYNPGYQKVFMLSCVMALFANFYLNTTLYPQMAAYSGQIAAADFINQNTYKKYHIYSLRTENNVFQFYCNRPVDFIPLEKFNALKVTDSSAFYVNQPSMDILLQSHVKFRLMKAFVNYPQENISLNFINKKARYKALGQVYLISK
jgi:4-amino-4-deoxy-L-arabinose transferase-like glycosyltransferase